MPGVTPENDLVVLVCANNNTKMCLQANTCGTETLKHELAVASNNGTNHLVLFPITLPASNNRLHYPDLAIRA
jgi:hypothetical protein